MSGDLELMLISKLTDAKECQQVWELGLRSQVFVDANIRVAFEWMMDYYVDSHMQIAPSWVVMETEFPSIRLERSVSESTEWLCDTLKRRYAANETSRVMLEVAERVQIDPLEAVNRMWHAADELRNTTAVRYDRADMSLNISERRQLYEARGLTQASGVPLGLAELDAHTRGILPGEVWAAAGYTKTGKTWLLALATIAARRAGFTPLLMTLEQPINEMQERLDALCSGMSYAQIQEGSLMPGDRDRLYAAQEELATLGPLYVERPGRGERTVKNMAARARQLGADMLVIDQLSFIDAEREYKGDRALTAKHGDLIFDLKDEVSRDAAGRLATLLAVQLNRDAVRERNNGGRGGLSNFANSSMIEQTVDVAIGLWRNQDMRANNTMGIDIMGSRRCDIAAWWCEWRLGDRTTIRIREENNG